MMNRVRSRFLVTTAVLLAGVGLASAQGVGGAGGGAGGAASEKGMSAGGHSGGGMGSGASGREGASHNEGMTQGRGSESRESGRAEGWRSMRSAQKQSHFIKYDGELYVGEEIDKLQVLKG